MLTSGKVDAVVCVQSDENDRLLVCNYLFVEAFVCLFITCADVSLISIMQYPI